MHKLKSFKNMSFIVSIALLGFLYLPAQGLIYHGVATPPVSQHAWVVTIETTAVFHTPNLGATWDSVNIPTVRDFFDVFFLTPDSGWTCGRAGDIWATTDGGSSWTRQNLGGPKHAARIRFVDGEFGWAAGGDIVQLRTTNGGAEWQQIFLPVPPFPAGDSAEFQGVWFVDHSYGWLVAGHWPAGDTFLGGQGLIVRTTNGGDSWEIVYRDTTYDFYDVYFADRNNGWVVGGDDRNFQAIVLHTTDGGVSWVPDNIPEGAKFLRAVKFVSPSCGWACGRSGTIIHTTDGSNWVLQHSNADSTLFDIDFADASTGMAAGNGITIVTTDGGEHWVPVLVGIQEPFLTGRMPFHPALILQNQLWCSTEGVLIDISGRKVRRLGSGMNDIGSLIPGVYFIVYNEPRFGLNHQKVIIK
ncbi:MAG: WD40/YVTN/BNR-like repeat-containing protein [candidate division WOR-3 bacterium]